MVENQSPYCRNQRIYLGCDGKISCKMYCMGRGVDLLALVMSQGSKLVSTQMHAHIVNTMSCAGCR